MCMFNPGSGGSCYFFEQVCNLRVEGEDGSQDYILYLVPSAISDAL